MDIQLQFSNAALLNDLRMMHLMYNEYHIDLHYGDNEILYACCMFGNKQVLNYVLNRYKILDFPKSLNIYYASPNDAYSMIKRIQRFRKTIRATSIECLNKILSKFLPMECIMHLIEYLN